ncbi:MAG: hypothetical protein WC489_06605 [Patescibacteria group bacterium]
MIKSKGNIFYLHNLKYIENYRKIILVTRKKRDTYRKILGWHIKEYYSYIPLWEQVLNLKMLPEIAFILSSSRSGSSVTVDVIKKQASSAKKRDRIILCIQAEEKPHFVLAGLFFPLIHRNSDELNISDISDYRWKILSKELLGEIGYPLAQSSDTKLLAIQLYGRLLLQWPEVNFGNANLCINKINERILETTKTYGTLGVYIDSEKYRTTLMLKIKKMYPQINLSYYDGLDRGEIDKNSVAVKEGPPSKYCLEEPPFIVLKPWHFASLEDVKHGIVLFKDPSDAWRIDFWKELFSKSQLFFIVLTRDPRDTINGLCKGWKFPYGFQTIPSPFELKIAGYSEFGSWQKKVVNFSTNAKIWKLISMDKSVDLEYVAGLQWFEAYKSIREGTKNERTLYLKFEDVRSDPLKAIAKICNHLNISKTKSLIQAAANFHHNKVQVTPGSGTTIHPWQYKKNTSKINKVANMYIIKSLAQKLGYQY